MLGADDAWGRPERMRIGELAGSLSLNPRTIRYYESIGLLPEPDRGPSGYRDYDDSDAERLRFIRTAQRVGLSLDEISRIIGLRDRGERPCGYVRELLRRQLGELDRRIEEMCRLRDEVTRLEGIADSLDEGEGTFCGLIENLDGTPTGVSPPA